MWPDDDDDEEEEDDEEDDEDEDALMESMFLISFTFTSMSHGILS